MEKRSLCWDSMHKRLALFVVAILSLCLLGSLIIQGVQKAQAVDVNRSDYSITANLSQPTEGQGTDQPENMVYKLYKVADALPLSGFDAFTLGATSQFSSLSAQVDQLNNALASNDSNAQTQMFEALAQSAAAVLADSETIAPNKTASIGTTASGLNAGLYLLVATNADGSGAGVVRDKGGSFVSYAYSGATRFTFNPQLVTVPTKAPLDGVSITSNPGDWIDSVDVTLKYEKSVSLRIIKNLPEIEQIVGVPEDATFVFNIEGMKDGVVEYSNVATIKFDKAGSNSVVLDYIPSGLTLVIKESYSGTSYQPSSENTVTITPEDQNGILTADGIMQVEFTNTYNGNSNRGGSVVNSFENTSGDWVWSKDGQVQPNE